MNDLHWIVMIEFFSCNCTRTILKRIHAMLYSSITDVIPGIASRYLKEKLALWIVTSLIAFCGHNLKSIHEKAADACIKDVYTRDKFTTYSRVKGKNTNIANDFTHSWFSIIQSWRDGLFRKTQYLNYQGKLFDETKGWKKLITENYDKKYAFKISIMINTKRTTIT